MRPPFARLTVILGWALPAIAIAQSPQMDVVTLEASGLPSTVVDLGRVGPIPGQTLRWLHSLEPRAVLGRDDAPGGVVFGTIRDVSFFETGVLVVDNFAPSVTAFSLDGSVIWSLHTRGDGPLDLREPMSASAAGDRVYIGEPRGVRMYKLDLSHQPQYKAVAKASALPYSQCIGPGSVILQSWDPTTRYLAHRLDRELRPTGTHYARLEVRGRDAGPAQLGFAYAEARVACLPDGAVIVAPRTNIAEIRAYEGDGRLRWALAFQGYRAIETRRVSGGFVTIPPENGYHRIESVASLGQDRILVQVAEMSLRSLADGSYESLQTLILSAQSGQVLEADKSLPPIMAMGAGCVAARPVGMFPTVEIRCPRG